MSESRKVIHLFGEEVTPKRMLEELATAIPDDARVMVIWSTADGVFTDGNHCLENRDALWLLEAAKYDLMTRNLCDGEDW